MRKYLYTIALNDVKCFARHGYYEQEQKTGSNFIVNAEVEFESCTEEDDIRHTVNYEQLNEIISEAMEQPRKLLETVLRNILSKITEAYPDIKRVQIEIKKLRPPFKGEVGHASVKLSYTSPN